MSLDKEKRKCPPTLTLSGPGGQGDDGGDAPEGKAQEQAVASGGGPQQPPHSMNQPSTLRLDVKDMTLLLAGKPVAVPLYNLEIVMDEDARIALTGGVTNVKKKTFKSRQRVSR